MNNMEFKKRLVAMRNSIQDYLDAMDMDEVENTKKPDKKPDKKPEPKGSDKSDVEEDEKKKEG